MISVSDDRPRAAVTSAAPAGVRVFVALGSNLDDPVRQVLEALDALDGIAGARVAQVSSLYRSRPMGGLAQPDYVNAVAELTTRLTAFELLDQLQRIEREHGRMHGAARWAPRTLDLDLLLYGDETIQTPRLHVPHPGMAARDFVLQPLYEIAPQLEIAAHGAVAALLARCPGHGLRRIGRPENLRDHAPGEP